MVGDGLPAWEDNKNTKEDEDKVRGFLKTDERSRTAMNIQTAARAKKFWKTLFSKPGGADFFSNESLSRCDRFRQIFVQIGAVLAIFLLFEIFRAV